MKKNALVILLALSVVVLSGDAFGGKKLSSHKLQGTKKSLSNSVSRNSRVSQNSKDKDVGLDRDEIVVRKTAHGAFQSKSDNSQRRMSNQWRVYHEAAKTAFKKLGYKGRIQGVSLSKTNIESPRSIVPWTLDAEEGSIRSSIKNKMAQEKNSVKNLSYEVIAKFMEGGELIWIKSQIIEE